jgi:hypothetical protein
MHKNYLAERQGETIANLKNTCLITVLNECSTVYISMSTLGRKFTSK